MISLNEITDTYGNERDVECPAFIKYVRQFDSPKSLLDVGAFYSYATYASEIRSILENKTYDGCDILEDPRSEEILDNYYVSNVTDLSNATYDIVSCISVIEHCGITSYKKDDIEAEQRAVFKKMVNLAERGLFITFPYGMPGLFPNQYSNIHSGLLEDFSSYWTDTHGGEVETQFFFSEFAPHGKPWSEIGKSEADLKPLRADLGIVQCVCLLSAKAA